MGFRERNWRGVDWSLVACRVRESNRAQNFQTYSSAKQVLLLNFKCGLGQCLEISFSFLFISIIIFNVFILIKLII
jgi:hypothetical protein